MSSLKLGPLLRYVGETEATVWVETDSPCEVTVLGTTERTFCVSGHHYAMLVLEGLQPGGRHEYEVQLDGKAAWPEGDDPAGVIRPPASDDRLTPAGCRCRTNPPSHSPRTKTIVDARSTLSAH